MKVTTNTHTESDDQNNSGKRKDLLSPGEIKLQQLDRRDSAFKGFLLFVLILAVGFNVFSGIQLQRQAEVARKETARFREANIVREGKTQEYIKCIVLLRFHEPPVTPLSTKAETTAALDTCAEKP